MKIRIKQTISAEEEVDPEDFKNDDDSSTPTVQQVIERIKEEAEADENYVVSNFSITIDSTEVEEVVK